MEIRPIKTEADYEAASQEIESLMTAEPHTPEGDRLEVLVTLVEAYEAKHYRKRPLTLEMIRRLHRELGIPAESLIQSQQVTQRL